MPDKQRAVQVRLRCLPLSSNSVARKHASPKTAPDGVGGGVQKKGPGDGDQTWPKTALPQGRGARSKYAVSPRFLFCLS